MKKLIVCLFLGALSVVTSSFAPVNGVAAVQNVDGEVTTCPACGCKVTLYDTKSELFSCPKCGCQWKKTSSSSTIVVIVSPPKEPDPGTSK